MVYALVVITLGIIIGSVGQAHDSSGLRELGTLALLAGLIMLARAIWSRVRGRRDEQRDSRL